MKKSKKKKTFWDFIYIIFFIPILEKKIEESNLFC